MPEDNRIKVSPFEANDDLMERLDRVEKDASANEHLLKAVQEIKQRLTSLREGKGVSASSTSRVDKTLRLTLLVGIPESMGMQELMREIGQIESRLNDGISKLTFKLET